MKPYSEQQVSQIKEDATPGSLEYIQELEERLSAIDAKCQEYLAVEHLSDILTELYAQFRRIPHNHNLCLLICPDGSGQISNWRNNYVFANWDTLENAKFALEAYWSLEQQISSIVQ